MGQVYVGPLLNCRKFHKFQGKFCFSITRARRSPLSEALSTIIILSSLEKHIFEELDLTNLTDGLKKQKKMEKLETSSTHHFAHTTKNGLSTI